MAVCLNCHIILRPNLQCHEYRAVDFGPELVNIIEEWCGRQINFNDFLCQQCVLLVTQENNNRTEDHNYSNDQQLGHAFVCISCGISVSVRTGRRRHELIAGSVERNHVENEVFPRQVPARALACHNCFMRARHNNNIPQADPMILMPPEPRINPDIPIRQEVDSAPQSASSEADSWGDINLPRPIIGENHHDIPRNHVTLRTYTRTSDSSAHCFVPGCNNEERLRVPNCLKRSILQQCKVYVTANARICQNHAMQFDFDFLNEFEFISSFNSSQIENMLTILAKQPSALNFDNVENMTDTVCHYWTGLTVLNFLSIFNSVPALANICAKAKTALAIYLIKLRIGEPYTRIASLFILSKKTVILYSKKVRNCLTTFYVPLHLGIGHINRQDHASRNLLIPQGLFGTAENNPIVICDGTYIYVQKSSNYLFQKLTYSLHKYANLVKPFLMVACDGYIIDAFGPYAATMSDAEIMKNLFQDIELPLRAYFVQNDVFILDRGFRDVLGLLSDLGYSIFKPEGLNPGERQLSTINANKSRFVTLCRWVVEAVNGRFKRDFKIFRAKYFNVASKNLMADFRIAAAMINNFHRLITNPPDAEVILNRAIEIYNLPNLLCDYVNQHNINRQRANFVVINAQLPQLNVFPIMEMRDLILFALGTYQIKQARSYYGEHIRQNGTFRVEVDTNLLRHAFNSVLLRGRIRSRHQGNRVYYTYILLDLSAAEWCQRIAQYYCPCIIGKRTVGSCAHVMTIVWYLGWARHQENPILPPASFLDGILVIEEEENEDEL